MLTAVAMCLSGCLNSTLTKPLQIICAPAFEDVAKPIPNSHSCPVVVRQAIDEHNLYGVDHAGW